LYGNGDFMLNHIRKETRLCAQAMVKAMRRVGKKRVFYLAHKNTTGYAPDVLFQKPELSLIGRQYYSGDSYMFGTFVVKDDKLWIRTHTHDLQKYPEGAYIDLNSNQPIIYLSSQYRRRHYQPVLMPEKEYNILRDKVKEIARYQEMYGCSGFLFQVNYMTVTMFIVFDAQGNPYHLSDGYNSIERFFS